MIEETNIIPARVVQVDRGFPLVRAEDGRQFRCKHATALVKGKKVRAVIGDEVLVSAEADADMAQIVEVLPRRCELVRRDPAERETAQVMAANFDLVVVAHPIHELNLRRLERELVLAHETGAQVAVALTKADLAPGESADEAATLVGHIVGNASGEAPRVPVLVISEADPASVEQLRALIPEGSVAVLIGRSGVGKSSLVNLLAGAAVQATTPVREGDGKGRHTTVNRAMVPVVGGGLVVDMPGVRGLGLWDADAGLAAAFPEIDELSAQCRFRDCTHTDEPECAVKAAVEHGGLHPERLASYVGLAAENRDQKRRREEAERLASRGRKPRR